MRFFKTVPVFKLLPASKSSATLLALLLLATLAACVRVQASGNGAQVASSPKIAPSVASVARQLASGASPASFTSGKVRTNAAGQVQVYVGVSDLSPSSQKQLEAKGLRNTVVSPEMHIVQGWILPRDLDAVAALSFVVSINPPIYGKVH